jgi:hypothetical protein
MTLTPALPPVPAYPKLTQPAWWLHILNLAIAAVAFVATVIHPGYHLPAVVSASVGVASLVFAGVSTVVILLEHHDLSLAPTAAHGYLAALEAWAHQVTAALTASPNPELQALSTRLSTAETYALAAYNATHAPPAPQAARIASSPPTAPVAAPAAPVAG